MGNIESHATFGNLCNLLPCNVNWMKCRLSHYIVCKNVEAGRRRDKAITNYPQYHSHVFWYLLGSLLVIGFVTEVKITSDDHFDEVTCVHRIKWN